MRKIYKVIIYVMIIIILIVLYARFIGTSFLKVKEYPIYSDSVPNDFDGIKIIHFSDLHYKRAITREKIDKIVDEINLIKPDIVVFTGDLIDKDSIILEDDIKYLKSTLSKINAKYAKYAVMGNHDYNKIETVENIYNDAGFNYLNNSYDIIYGKNSGKIFISGISSVSYKQDDMTSALEYLKDNKDIDYKIVLVHEPDFADSIINEYSVDLILSGHSHNGQIRIPLVGALYTPENAKKYYDEYYSINNTDLYISSGIGVSKYNYRLFNHPSFNLYRIYKEKTS